VRPAAAGNAARADHLASDRAAREVDANNESLGILVFAGVRFAAFGRVQEEPSAPQTRLAYIHLQNSSVEIIGTRKKSNRSTLRIKEKKQKKIGKNQRRANAN
jgi:hypothetical protein